MSVSAYGVSTGLAASATFNQEDLDTSLNDIQETVVQSNVLVPLSLAQFDSILDIDPSAGTASFNTTNLTTILESHLNEGQAITTSMPNSIANVYASSATEVGDETDASEGTSAKFYALSTIADNIKTKFGRQATTLKRKVAAKALGSSYAFGASNPIDDTTLDNVFTALVNANIADTLNTDLNNIGINGKEGQTPISVTTNTDNVNESELFSFLADGNYIHDASDNINGQPSLAVNEGFALGVTMTLQGFMDLKTSFSPDTQLTGVSSQTNLIGNLANTSVITGSALSDGELHDAIESGVGGKTTGLNSVTFTILLVRVA